MAKVTFDQWAAREAERARFPDGKRVKDPVKMKYVDLETGYYYDAPTKRAVEDVERYREREMQFRAAEERRMREMDGRWIEPKAATAREVILDNISAARMIGDKRMLEHWMATLHEYDLGGAPEVKRQENTFAPWDGTVATVHKAGHFPTQWMTEAVDRAEASEMCVTLTVEREGILVTAMEADERFDIRVTDWNAMEHAETNPLIPAIESCENKLRLLEKVKAASGHG